ncbi:universal stress protein UspC [Pantoea sp. B65]|uniref:universal stress protein UspC n=1 Tax=Pantoea sp. B65 TaxID=2813359 RepID=UPI0039B39F15
MAYNHALVAITLAEESHLLVAKAVSIVRPDGGKVSLITLAADPELYNHFAAPMLENPRQLMHEELQLFIAELKARANYPISHCHIACGELGHHLIANCRQHQIDLVVCGNHNQHFFKRLLSPARRVINCSEIDVLIVPL